MGIVLPYEVSPPYGDHTSYMAIVPSHGCALLKVASEHHLRKGGRAEVGYDDWLASPETASTTQL